MMYIHILCMRPARNLYKKFSIHPFPSVKPVSEFINFIRREISHLDIRNIVQAKCVQEISFRYNLKKF